MFTRSRCGRRATPGRLNVERLEDRFVPHVPALPGGFSALALVGPVAVAPSSDESSHGRPVADHSANEVLARLQAAWDAGRTGDHGPPADGGHDKGPGESDPGPSARQDGRAGGSTSGKSDHDARFIYVLDRLASATARDKGEDTSDDKSRGATAKAGPSSSDDDSTADAASSRRVRSEDTADDASGPVTTAHTGRTQEATGVALSTATAPAADDGEGSDASAAGKRVAYLGLIGPVQAAEAAADGGSTQSPTRPAASTATAPAVPLRLSDRPAAAEGGDDNSPATAPTAALAGRGDAVLTILDLRAAVSGGPHGRAELTDGGVEVTLSAGVNLERGGVLAEGAAPDGEAPASSPAAYAAFAARPAPFAGALLDRLSMDTRALDEALQGFLRGLDRLGEHLSDPRARLGVSAWLLSGAAALAVLELSRRRRAAAAGNADGVPLSWLDPEGPAPEPVL
jgi:hypothetical protein